ncbi:solute carrier family 22 member 6-A-like [Heptranchias perlo]|uniref:solute carrier family 22 member 6-A-like n=1 Tax=Heptranchias perlo TaxID=212740 RepID=UPI003559AA20
MGFTDLLENVGSMGKFQIIQAALLAIPFCTMACHNLLQNFTGAVPNHHCRVQPELNGSKYDKPQAKELLRIFIPQDRKQQPEKCRVYSSPQWHLLDLNVTLDNVTDYDTEQCTDGWTYDTSEFSSTIITEIWVKNLFSAEYSSPIQLSSVEWTPTNMRTLISTINGYSYTSGQLLLAGLAYGIRDWRWLQFTVSAPYFIFFLYSWWFPESARWLILNNKTDVALKQLKRVAKLNGKEAEGNKLTTTVAAVKSSRQTISTPAAQPYSNEEFQKWPYLRSEKVAGCPVTAPPI